MDLDISNTYIYMYIQEIEHVRKWKICEFVGTITAQIEVKSNTVQMIT